MASTNASNQQQDLENLPDPASKSTSNSNITNTIQAAKAARCQQGYHETEVSFGGEADLHQLLIDCEKNPEHNNFIPVSKFGVSDLPEGYQDQDIVDYIQAQAELTVRLKVTYTSKARPKGYPFSELGGCSFLRMGTGFVQYMYKCDKRTDKPCPCPECKESGSPKPYWAKLKIRTAWHVVFDAEEADSAVVELFYDETLDRVKRVYGDSVRFGAIDGDWCDMRCVTHDLELYEQLKDAWGRWRWRETKVNQKYQDLSADHRLAVLVSHPHGYFKQVSVGAWRDREVVDCYKGWENCVYTYDTPSCPGSSGAPVWLLGKVRWGGFFGRHPHSGAPPGSGVNISATGWERITAIC